MHGHSSRTTHTVIDTTADTAANMRMTGGVTESTVVTLIEKTETGMLFILTALTGVTAAPSGAEIGEMAVLSRCVVQTGLRLSHVYHARLRHRHLL